MTATDIAAGLAGSFSQLKTVTGVSVTFGRGDLNVALVAVAGSSQFAEQTGEGYVETAETRDFLILAADLKFGNEPVRPERGDTITEVVDGVEQTYPLYSPTGDRFYNWSDPYRTILRVHCLRTS